MAIADDIEWVLNGEFALGTARIDVRIPNLGFCSFRVINLKRNQGKTVAVYGVRRKRPSSHLHQWTVIRTAPHVLTAYTHPNKPSVKVHWVAFALTLLSNNETSIIGPNPIWETSFIDNTELYQPARAILLWLRPIQERLDELFDSLGLSSEDLYKFDLSPFVNKEDPDGIE